MIPGHTPTLTRLLLVFNPYGHNGTQTQTVFFPPLPHCGRPLQDAPPPNPQDLEEQNCSHFTAEESKAKHGANDFDWGS